MPFDVLPQETKVKVGKFQEIADAILRGCAIHPPTPRRNAADRDDAGNLLRTCVWSAVFVGYGLDPVQPCEDLESRMREAWGAYRDKYDEDPVFDFVECSFTREQIAARIAAL